MIESLIEFQKKKICVIGDFMLDCYTKGSVKRISPEAPVCVLKVLKQEYLPGGAGNVALNLIALGADVYACGRLGHDFASDQLKKNLLNAGVNTAGLIIEQDYQTPLKNRFMASYQQLLRVDFEQDQPIQEVSHNHIVAFLKNQMPFLDLLLISDYNKGLLSIELLSEIMAMALHFQVPVFVDPKGHDFTKYKGANLIKPNLNEAYLASGLDEKSSLDDVARVLIKASDCQHLLITRSEKGMSLFAGNIRKDFQACAKEVVDVTGAGDTVISTLAVTYASGLDIETCIKWANMAASCAIEKLGCVHVGKKELLKALTQNENRYKFLANLSHELAALLLSERNIHYFPCDEETLNLDLLSKLSKYKQDHPEDCITVIIPSDAKIDLVQSLCDFNVIDYIIPNEMRELVNQSYCHSFSL